MTDINIARRPSPPGGATPAGTEPAAGRACCWPENHNIAPS